MSNSEAVHEIFPLVHRIQAVVLCGTGVCWLEQALAANLLDETVIDRKITLLY